MADKKEQTPKPAQEHAEITKPDTLPETTTPADDPELDDLLDSALEDFDKPPPASHNAQETESQGVSAPPPSLGMDPNQDPMAMFEQIFAAAAAGGGVGGMENDEMNVQHQMAEAMKAMMGEADPSVMQHLDSLAKAAGNADESEESQQAFTNTLQSTLDSLTQNATNIQGEMSEEDLMRAMGGLGLGDDAMGEGDLDFMPMMQGMLKSLLSKEVLYPSLKEISGKYPAWLSENKSTLEAEEYSGYEQQYQYMTQICSTFEEEKETDSDSVKARRFQKVMDLMQEMQNLGQPPKEIVGDMMPGLGFDAQGNPQIPGMGGGQMCSIM